MMESKEVKFLKEESDALGIFKTLFLFFEHHKFAKTAETLREEWGLNLKDLEKIPTKSVFLAHCKCSKTRANQTEMQKKLNFQENNNSDWLEGTFQGETFQIKPDDTHIFYVCDHSLINKKQELDPSSSSSSAINNKKYFNNEEIDSPRYKVKNLQSKFSQLQIEHDKLIAVTSELTTALQMNIIGQTKNINSVLEQCKQIYPNLFHINKNNEEKLDNLQHNHHHHHEQENLNLEKFEQKHCLTPETVRYILEKVFERIFQKETDDSHNNNGNNPLNTNKENLMEKVVDEVLQDISIKNAPSICGGGEGEFSKTRAIFINNNNRNSSDFYIDFAKLKSDLMHGENERKIRILQALRWRITKNDGPTRKKMLNYYITNDIMDLFADISIPERLLLGYHSDHYVQEAACRLLNTLASLRQGRDYLTVDERLLKRVLIKKVKDVKILSGAVIRNMLVASVQKLSIRKLCRILMVKEGLFEIIVDYMNEFYEKLSKYCLEYSSALLMNLCLVEEAKNRAINNSKKIIGLLKKFLDSENETYLPYINGIMFSLFEKSEIVKEATKENLEKIIIKLIQTSHNENIKKQLDFILQARLFGSNDQNLRDDDDDDENNKEEVDLLEFELDQDDFITQLPSGEILLQEYKTHHHLDDGLAGKKDPPNSARSYSEERNFIKNDAVIFENTAKPRNYATCSHQNLSRNCEINKNRSHYSSTNTTHPLCYMENCQKMLHGNNNNVHCSCTKCGPGQSKYSCGCYELIKKDIEENDLPSDAKNSSLIIIKSSTNSSDKIIKSADDGRIIIKCKICGEKKCDCAFDSKPKLCRTPINKISKRID